MSAAALQHDLARRLGADAILDPASRAGRPYLSDATHSRGIAGAADAVVLPATPAGVADVLAYAYAHDVPVTPRGAGTGYAAGAVPDGGIVVGVERLGGVPRVDPARWSMRVPAGTTTAQVRQRAAEHGLLYPPDPGSMESSLIAGNIATNAGGPHTFKYGVTGHWVRGLLVAVAPGELIELGHPLSKDVSALDLTALMVGSEGTLGIICAADLALIPRPQRALPILGRYPSVDAGAAALEAVLACGVRPAALEYLDAGAAGEDAFLLLAEVDGTPEGAASEAALVADAMTDGADSLEAPNDPRAIAELWRWREGISLSVTARRGGKLSEDIVVPVDRLGEAVARVLEIGDAHGLEACSWGHAGDGNLHATFLIDRGRRAEVERAEAAAEDLFVLALELGGTVSGEHGIGRVKRTAAVRALPPGVRRLQAEVKSALDPKGLLNPQVKLV